MTELTDRDLTDLVYDLSEASIFFPEPPTVEIDGRQGALATWEGFGGFSWSLFQRGAYCNLCGNCCKNTHRRVWFWWPGERHPDNTQTLPITINGAKIDLQIHVNSDANGMARCDFLSDLDYDVQNYDGIWRKAAGCSLHGPDGGIKPNHCRTHPQTGVYKVRVGKTQVPMLSRRLPSRNFRWPTCPVDLKLIPLDAEQIATDTKMWQTWVEGYGNVPGCFVWQAYALWEELVNGPVPTTNILFKDRLLINA